jgi:hypothetical protein
LNGKPEPIRQKERTMTITNLSDLSEFLDSVPEGTTADILASDLEAGNFDVVHLVQPDGTELDVAYTGPVAPFYVSPFEDA